MYVNKLYTVRTVAVGMASMLSVYIQYVLPTIFWLHESSQIVPSSPSQFLDSSLQRLSWLFVGLMQCPGFEVARNIVFNLQRKLKYHSGLQTRELTSQHMKYKKPKKYLPTCKLGLMKGKCRMLFSCIVYICQPTNLPFLLMTMCCAVVRVIEHCSVVLIVSILTFFNINSISFGDFKMKLTF